jgi:hypothetical protein
MAQAPAGCKFYRSGYDYMKCDLDRISILPKSTATVRTKYLLLSPHMDAVDSIHYNPEIWPSLQTVKTSHLYRCVSGTCSILDNGGFIPSSNIPLMEEGSIKPTSYKLDPPHGGGEWMYIFIGVIGVVIVIIISICYNFPAFRPTNLFRRPLNFCREKRQSFRQFINFTNKLRSNQNGQKVIPFIPMGEEGADNYQEAGRFKAEDFRPFFQGDQSSFSGFEGDDEEEEVEKKLEDKHSLAPLSQEHSFNYVNEDKQCNPSLSSVENNEANHSNPSLSQVEIKGEEREPSPPLSQEDNDPTPPLSQVTPNSYIPSDFSDYSIENEAVFPEDANPF